MFDLAWEIEQGNNQNVQALTLAQNQADAQLLDIYLKTLDFQSTDEATKSPIHQLFYHRLIGGRLERFYDANTAISLPGHQYRMGDVRNMRWRINGQKYQDSLNILIQRASNLLKPSQNGLSIIGHGDAHNGNVFFRADNNPPSLLYFDPAFAGRHNPLLDLAKPLFHNVFAMWMYYPQIKAEETTITMHQYDEYWSVEYDYELPSIREMFLESKVERVLIPILKELRVRGQLRLDWQSFLKSALFCCPFLTMNLADNTKFPPKISLLGLSMAIEMGAESAGKRSLIDRVLDQVTEEVN